MIVLDFIKMASQTYYELLYIIDPSLKEEENLSLSLRAKDILTKANASIISEERIGVRRLAYPIKKFRQGSYFIINFEADPLNVKEVNHEFRLWTGVLRHVVTLRPKMFLEKREIARPVQLEEDQAAYQEPAVQRELVTDELAQDQAFSKEELDKKLEEILNN